MMQFEEMMDRIGSNNEVPERVWKKLDNVLNDLPDYEEELPFRRRGRQGGEGNLYRRQSPSGAQCNKTFLFQQRKCG